MIGNTNIEELELSLKQNSYINYILLYYSLILFIINTFLRILWL